MLRARVTVTITCSQCEESYAVALGLPAIAAMGDQRQIAHLPAPQGWVASTEQALCPAHAPPLPGAEEPPPEVLRRAIALQALARNSAATDGERRNAWSQFEKLWKKYKLPEDLGL